MSESIEMTGWVSAKKEVRTLKDLRDLVAWCNQYKLKDESVVDYGGGPYLYVDFMGEDEVSKATWIECGDHLWGDEQWDVLIETHRHPEHEDDEEDDTLVCAVCGISDEHEDFGNVATAKFNEYKGDYDFLCEVCAAEKPAKYDWPAKDKKKSAHRTAADYCHDNGHSYADAEDICYVCGAKS